MKILQINKFYHQKGKSGGTGRYFLSLIDLLKKHNHQIQVFAMKDKNCLPSIYSPYFVEEQDFSRLKLSSKIILKGIKFIYSFEAKKKIEKLIKNEKPDLAHLHNIYHHITPSILPVLKRYNIPVVQTLHDFHLISPNYNLYSEKDGIHEECSRGKYWKAIIHKCIKNSRSASVLSAAKMYFEKITKIYIKNIDIFISPSQFLMNKYIENGFPANKIIFLRPFIDLKKYKPKFSPGNYVLYFGRIHPQKGVRLLLEAASMSPNISFKIVGAGKEKESLIALIKEKKLKNTEIIEPQYGNVLKNTIRNATFVVVPSLSYENAPFAALEAFALGKPVIASNLGGLPELIKHKSTGLLFKAGDVEDLKEKILSLSLYPCLIRTMGVQARLFVEKNFSPEKHYQDLMNIYKKALQQD
ncbi:glycosyltransferase [bacterium]|nr:MAG: glycosyltransferase [bacterium]